MRRNNNHNVRRLRMEYSGQSQHLSELLKEGKISQHEYDQRQYILDDKYKFIN